MIRETIASALRAIGFNNLADKVTPPNVGQGTSATHPEVGDGSQDVNPSSWEAKMRGRDASTNEVNASDKNGCPQKNGCKQHDKNSCGKNSCR